MYIFVRVKRSLYPGITLFFAGFFTFFEEKGEKTVEKK